MLLGNIWLFLLNIMILISEILYLSLFSKKLKEISALWRYILSFAIISIIMVLIDYALLTFENNILFRYLISMFMWLLSLKYIGKIKIVIFDLPIFTTMLIIELLLQMPIFIIFGFNKYLSMIIFYLLLPFIPIIFGKRANKLYNNLLKKWNNNHFFTRYGSSLIILIYIILAFLFFIFFK